jgi:hypothetical protein
VAQIAMIILLLFLQKQNLFTGDTSNRCGTAYEVRPPPWTHCQDQQP